MHVSLDRHIRNPSSPSAALSFAVCHSIMQFATPSKHTSCHCNASEQKAEKRLKMKEKLQTIAFTLGILCIRRRNQQQ